MCRGSSVLFKEPKAACFHLKRSCFLAVVVSDVRDFINRLLSSAPRETIWSLRVDFLQERVLSQWESFTVWNAGKQGRRLYRSLSPTNQKKVPDTNTHTYKRMSKYPSWQETLTMIHLYRITDARFLVVTIISGNTEYTFKY